MLADESFVALRAFSDKLGVGQIVVVARRTTAKKIVSKRLCHMICVGNDVRILMRTMLACANRIAEYAKLFVRAASAEWGR